MNQRSVTVHIAVLALLASGAIAFLPFERQPATAAAKRSTAKPVRICGNPVLTDADVDAIELAIQAQSKGKRVPPNAGPAPLGTIQVAFHVIYFTDGFFTIGLLTEAEVEAQIAALNAAYDNVDFDLVRDFSGAPTSITYTANIDWFLMTRGSVQELQAKTALAWDSNRFLNIYTIFPQGASSGPNPNISFEQVGWSSFPWDLRRNPLNDGVVIPFDTIPGGLPPFDEGDVCVHQVGHWAGLFHTYQGGCSNRNDRVADTPAEAGPNLGCPAFRDTCPASGSDPINNFMDDSDDICRTQFTPGQATRMNQMINLFRTSVIQ